MTLVLNSYIYKKHILIVILVTGHRSVGSPDEFPSPKIK